MARWVGCSAAGPLQAVSHDVHTCASHMAECIPG
jgi:hypothetical protein